jgi:membrane protease YdiL (CAAX protease family)
VTPAATSVSASATPLATPPLAYHRLSHANPAYRWWKPLVVAVVAFVIYLIFAIVVLRLLEGVASTVLSETEYIEYSRQILTPNSVLTSPLAIAALLLSVLVMTPALFLSRRLLGLGGLGFLSSVAGRLRWRWFGIALVPAAAYMAVQLIIGYGVAPLFDTEPLGAATVSATTFGLSLVVILMLVPLQASAEEYVFRGFVMQAVGGWVRWPVIAVVASTIPFVLGHIYNVWGLLEVLVFALVAAWVTLRTGGLEAAIGVHILTNVIAFSVPALGFENVTESNGSPEGLVTAAILLPLYAWGVDVLFRRSGLSRTLEGVAPVEPSPQRNATEPSPQPDSTTPPAVGGTS